MPELTTIKIEGQSIPVHINPHGLFSATFEDEQYTAETLKGLANVVTKALRTQIAGLKVPFTVVTRPEQTWNGSRYTWMSIRLRHGIARGINAHQRKPLVTYDDGKKDTLGSETVLRRLTEVEEQAWAQLREAMETATAAYNAWIEEHKMDLSGELRTALAAAKE